MSVVRVYKPKYRLARQLRTDPNITTATAIRQAEAAVASLRERLLTEVDDQIARAEAALIDVLGTADREATERIYDCGDRLSGVAGACGLGALGDAALGACDLIDWMRQNEHWEPNALAVHVAALRLLRGGPDEAAAKDVLDGLARVRTFIFEPSPRPAH